MARRIRRRPRQLWLPVLGNRGVDDEGQTIPGSSSSGVDILLTNSGTAGSPIVWEAVPITFDQGPDQQLVNPFVLPATPQWTLRDLVAGNEWSIRRIVGKVFCGVIEADGNPGNSERAPALECGFGLIVCNTDDDGTPTTNFTEVNPLVQESAEDPWIFQRQWLFGTNIPSALNYTATPLNNPDAITTLPMHNTQCGSVMDGPHVDAKTIRRVHRSERLFAVFATRLQRFNPATADSPSSDITAYCNIRLRLLGNIRSARGNRGNASR